MEDVRKCVICRCDATSFRFGFPVCEYHCTHGEADPMCPVCKYPPASKDPQGLHVFIMDEDGTTDLGITSVEHLHDTLKDLLGE